jgi:type IV pilus assembly protein PilY1
MNRSSRRLANLAGSALAAVALGLAPLPAQAGTTDLADVPMAVANSIKANFLVVFDNSQSMDGNMAGVVLQGDNPDTRGNIGRGVLRDVLGAYRNTFRWGLMRFATSSLELRWPLAEYMGSDEGLAFTDDCVGGISASHGNRRCIANPQASSLENSGDKYVTYDKSGDDLDVLDVLYWQSKVNQMWAFTPEANRTTGSNIYSFWQNHQAGTLAWAASEFSTSLATMQLVATDAGFMPTYPTTSRMLLLLRGWGYRSGITGGGKLVESVQSDSTEHYANLIKSLAAETGDGSDKTEIKNGAVYTPLAGTLESVKNYFSGQADWKSAAQYSSPISASCQKNFVLLVTDGMPTGNKSGGLYTAAQRTDSCSAWNAEKTTCTGSWTFGAASSETLSAVDALRPIDYSGCDGCSSFDVQTYVVAMGDAVANAQPVALMNEMAKRGGTGQAFFAADEDSMRNAIEAATRNAEAKTGAAAAVAVSNAIVTKDTVSFQSTFYSGNWTGDLKAYSIDPETGALLEPALWSAQSELAKRSASDRKIASYNGSDRGVRFLPSDGTGATLSAEQQALVSASDGAGIVNYIRGDRSGETATAETAQKYRQRTAILGDIVNAEPVVLVAPAADFSEATNPGYAAFKTSRQSRSTLVLQGANDGMLHAFNAASGNEAWAYVPSLLLPTLANLSRLTDFVHKYYVDGTPTVADVDFDRTGGGAGSGSPDWRSIMVGGLGRGGRGYYAIDVTNDVPTDEASVAATVLWEFPNSSTPPQVVANLGYSFGRPVIAKVGDQGWVVLVTSGYNNINTVTVTVEGTTTNYTGDGGGHLFVLNAKTGALIKDLPTGSGSTASPSGLASFSGYLESASVDNTVSQVYAGDLDGKVWRFDLIGAPTDWKVSQLAALVDDAGNAQPVTTAPELATIFEDSATYRFVYVGTGRYLGDSDVTTTATQTMYGLIDDLTTTPLINPLRANLQQQTLSVMADPQYRSASDTSFALSGSAKKRGWYVDLPVAGERISTDPQLAFGALAFTSNVPSLESCVPGGSSYFNILDYRTGGLLEGMSWSSHFLGKALASRVVLERLGSGEVIAVIRMSDATTHTESVPAPLAVPVVRRVSWRELPDSSK